MYNALIVGAGQIAGGFDDMSDECILTHAHAYTKNSNINLLGFYDTNAAQAEFMAKKWNTKAFNSLQKAQSVDIVSICVPDEYHTQTTLKVANLLKPKLIFLEKPICKNKKDIELLREVKIPILVNYSRRFCQSFRNLAQKIKNNEFGKYQCGNAFYTKGFIHNGSHMMDLLFLLLGKIVKCEIFNSFYDFYDDDATKSAILSFENGKKLTLNGCDCRNFTIFECDLIFEKTRVRMLNSGFEIEIYSVENDAQFKGYKTLDLKEKYKTDLDFAMKNAVDNIVGYLQNGEKLLCTLDDGYKAIQYD